MFYIDCYFSWNLYAFLKQFLTAFVRPLKRIGIISLKAAHFKKPVDKLTSWGTRRLDTGRWIELILRDVDRDHLVVEVTVGAVHPAVDVRKVLGTIVYVHSGTTGSSETVVEAFLSGKLTGYLNSTVWVCVVENGVIWRTQYYKRQVHRLRNMPILGYVKFEKMNTEGKAHKLSSAIKSETSCGIQSFIIELYNYICIHSQLLWLLKYLINIC